MLLLTSIVVASFIHYGLSKKLKKLAKLLKGLNLLYDFYKYCGIFKKKKPPPKQPNLYMQRQICKQATLKGTFNISLHFKQSYKYIFRRMSFIPQFNAATAITKTT